jgi:putative sterol carrier protein
MTPLSPEWEQRLVAGSGAAPARPGVDARVAVRLGTTVRRVLDIRDGRVVAVGDGDTEADVELPLTADQLSALAAGELSLARAYMRGDLKPVGSSGAVAVAVEVFEDDQTWHELRR